MSVPKLRFEEFSGEWESTTLSKSCIMNPKSSKLPSNFIYIDLESVANGKLLKENYINILDAPSRAQRLLWNNDILYQTVRPYQKNNYFFKGQNNMVVASTGYAQLRCDTNIPQYVYQYIHNDVFVSNVMLRCTGTSYPAINSTDLGSVKVSLPTLQEQQKIAEFLSAFDEKIENQQNIIKNLEQQKKGFMQKIFSQELRFKDQNGNDFPQWEEKKLGEICEMIGGGTPSKQVEEFWTGNIPWISSSDISDYSIKNIAISRYITHNAISKSATKLCPKGTICIVSRVGVGKLAVTNEELCTSQDFTNITRFEGNILFLAYLLSMRMKMEAEKTQGTSIKGITVSEIKSFLLFLPSLSEQQKIADFLSAFDEKIQTEKQILIHLQNTKKGLLQQMFC